MKYTLIYQDDKSDKFWNIDMSGNEYTVTYGKTGTNGTSKTKSLDNEDLCLKEVEKLAQQKLKKGYVHAGGGSSAVQSSSTPTAPKAAPQPKGESIKKVEVEPATVHDIPQREIEPVVVTIDTPESGIQTIEALIAVNELMAATDLCEQLFAMDLTDQEKTVANRVAGQLAFQKKDFAFAEELFLKSDKSAYFLLGDLYLINKEYTRAFAYYEKVGSFEACFKAGSCAKDKGLKTEAIQFFKKAIELGEAASHPELWDAYLKLGALYHPDNIELAEELYLKSVSFENANERVYNNLAVLYINTKRNNEVLKVLDEAIEKFPEHSFAYFNKACFYALQNEIDEANNCLNKALYYGYDFSKVERDEDLKVLRDTDNYKEQEIRHSFENRYFYGDNKKALAEFPEVISNINFYSLPKSKTYPEGIKNARNAEELQLEGALKSFPEVFLQLKKLKELRLRETSIQEFSEEFLNMELESVDIETRFLDRFPSELGRLKNLTQLEIGSLKFEEIPKEIGHFKDLTGLTIKHAKVLKSIDREIGSLSNLYTLEIRDTSLENLPIQISEIRNLKQLIITDNPEIKYLPEEIFCMPNLNDVTFHKNGFPSLEATKLFEEGQKNETAKHDMAIFLALLQGNEAYLQKNASIQHILLALNSSVKMLREKAQLWLGKQELTTSLDANSEILILGKFEMSLAEVKDKIAGLGYQVAKKWSKKTTHVLVGDKPGNKLLPLLDESTSWITEKHLNPQHDIDEAPVVELNDMMEEQIKTLLHSEEDTNLTMAIEIIEASQSTRYFALELFLAYQYSGHKDNKKNILSLIKKLEDEKLLTVFAKKYGFKTASEKKLTEYITTIPAIAGFDEVKFASTLFAVKGTAVDYLLQNGTTDQRKEVLKSLVEENVLKFDSDCVLKTLPEEIGEMDSLIGLDLFFLKLKDFPVFLTSLTNLENINICKTRIKSLPKEITKLKKVKVFNLNSCSFKKFPKELYQLDQLEELLMGVGYSDSSQSIGDLPEGISNLKNLRELDLGGNNISILPSDFGQLEALEELDLSENPITSLPENFGELKSLKTLNISCVDNVVDYDCSALLAKLSALESLTISSYQFELYSELSKLTSLKKLTIKGRRLKDKDWIALGKEILPNCEITTGWHYTY